MAGDQGERAAHVAMGERDAGSSSAAECCRDAWNHRHLDAMGFKVINLLAATAEDEGIAGFQPHHALAGLCGLQQQGVDAGLVDAVAALALADSNALGIAPRPLQHSRRHQIIVDTPHRRR